MHFIGIHHTERHTHTERDIQTEAEHHYCHEEREKKYENLIKLLPFLSFGIMISAFYLIQLLSHALSLSRFHSFFRWKISKKQLIIHD